MPNCCRAPRGSSEIAGEVQVSDPSHLVWLKWVPHLPFSSTPIQAHPPRSLLSLELGVRWEAMGAPHPQILGIVCPLVRSVQTLKSTSSALLGRRLAGHYGDTI